MTALILNFPTPPSCAHSYHEMPRFFAVDPGDSMAPTINRGDEIWVDTCAKLDRDGIYRVEFTNAPGFQTFVRVRICPRGVKLIYDNKRYRPEFVPTRKLGSIRVIGRAVLVGRFL